MIRHKRSFFISVAIHLSLFVFLVFAWDSYIAKTEIKDEKISIKLCNVEIPSVVEEVKEPKVVETPKQELPKKTQEIKKTTPNRVEIAQVKPPKKEELEATKIENQKEYKPQVQQEIQQQIKSQKEEPVIAKKEVVLPKEDKEEEYIKVNIQKIAELIAENLHYPVSARRKGISGLVIVKFSLNMEAKISNIEIVESSHEILSLAAKQTIEELCGKFPKPKEEVTLRVPINYGLK